jgi:hypothetical protein
MEIKLLGSYIAKFPLYQTNEKTEWLGPYIAKFPLYQTIEKLNGWVHA